MLEATDILIIVIAFCVLWVTAFVCWFIYQVTITLKYLNDFVCSLKWQIEKIEHALNGMKVKFETGSGHLENLVEHVKAFAGKKTKK